MSTILSSNKFRKTITALILLLPFHFSLFTFHSLTAQVRPDQIPGLQLWLRADSNVVLNGSNVAEWRDCSGNNNNVIQSTSSYQPALISSVSGINNKAVVRFDGADDYLDGGDIMDLGANSNTIYIIGKSNSGTGTFLAKSLAGGANTRYALLYESSFLLMIYVDDNSRNISVSRGSFNYELLCLINNRVNSTNFLRANSQQIGLSGINSSYDMASTFSFLIGAYNNSLGGAPPYAGYFLNGDIAEIIFFNKILTDGEREIVEKYIQNKYSPPVNLGADIIVSYGFCDTTINAGSGFLSYQWSTGETSQSILVDSTGYYSVTVTDRFGLFSSDTIFVQYPVVSLNDTSFCVGDSVLLSSGLGVDYTYNWTGGYSSPAVYINTAGNYSVTITDTLSCSQIISDIYVSTDTFTLTTSLGPDTNVCGNNPISLLSPNPLPSGLSFIWSTSETTEEILVDSSGYYSVTVTNGNGCIASDTIHVNIVGSAPNADFSNIRKCSGDTTNFYNQSVPSGTSWLWDFGDGETSTLKNPAHVYSAGGDYIVNFTVFDGACSKTISKQININTSPNANFNVSTACIDNPYSFSDISISAEGSIISWDWDFGDSSVHSSEFAPIHIYNSSGVFDVMLTIANDSGCQSICTKPLEVVLSAEHPVEFTLYQPVNGFVTTDSNLEFRWNSSENVQKYTFEYSADSLFQSNITRIQSVNSETIHITFANPQKYFWRILAFNICGDSVISNVSSFSIYSADLIAGLSAWFNPDSVLINSGLVQTLYDQSFNGNDVSQTNNLYRPTVSSGVSQLNNNSVVRFDGSNDYLDGGNVLNINSNSNSIYIVGKSNANTGTYIAKSLAGYANNSYAVFYESTFNYLYRDDAERRISVSRSYGEYELITAITNRTTCGNTLIANNQILGNGAINSAYSMNSSFNFLIGAYNNFTGTVPPYGLYLNGDIAEIMMFNKVLSTSEKNLVEGYLNCKYAPPINLGPDITVEYGLCDTTLNAEQAYYNTYLWSTGETAPAIQVATEGFYWVEVVNIFGRTSRDSVYVKYPYTKLIDRTLCITDTIEVNTGLNNNYTFQWSDSSTDSIANIFTPGTWWLEITDSTAAHCSLRDTFIVYPDSFPVVASLGADTTLCAGNHIELMAGYEPGIDYVWSTGDTTESLAVFTNGTYWVEAVNENGCTMRDSIDVYIHGVKPTVAFASNTPCLGNASAFTDLSYAAAPDGVAAWSWDFAGLGSSAQQHPQFEFGAAGDYNVELVVTTDSGCFGDTTLPVHVRSLPQAHFSPVNGCNGQSISFRDETAEAEGSLFSWNWNFGDGHTDNGQNPLYTYADTGIYTVTLISSDIYGCADTAEREITIRLTPEVDFSFQESCLGLPTAFAETTDMPGWAGIISRIWKFGDGTASSAKNPTHMYSMAGGYPVTLINRSINGCVDSTTKVVLVYPYPVAGFTSGVACEGNEVCFVDTSYVENGVIAQWNWNFGNSDSDTVSAPCTEYADTGFYQVQLEVASDFGCSSIISKSIEVHPVPQSDFSLTPEYGIPPLEVQFYNYTQGAIGYNWAFGDGAYSSALNPQHVYNSESIYNIILVSENMFGCTDTASANVYVIPSVLDLVLMNLQVTDSAGYLNLKAQFFNNGTRNIRKVALDARVGNNIPIREEWNGFLEPGQYGQYHFTASFLKPDISNVRLVCMDISTLDSYGQRDTEPENNASCYSLVEDFFIASVFPSPASDYIYADISVPDDGDVEISLISRDGRKLISEVLEDTEAGTLRVKMDLRFLADGMYILHAAFADKTDMYRFVKTTE